MLSREENLQKQLDILTQTDMLKALTELAVKRDELEQWKKDNEEKIDFYNVAMNSKENFEMSTVAKVLNVKGLGRNKLFEFLREQKVLRHNNEPYQQQMDLGNFELVEQAFYRNGESWVNKKPVVTQKGIEYIRKLLVKEFGEGVFSND